MAGEPELHRHGYQIHRKAQKIPQQLCLVLKKQAGKAAIIFNNTKRLRGNDKKRRQAFLNPEGPVKTFMKSLFAFAMEKHPNLLPNSFVVLKSLPGCKSQLPHCDYTQDETFNPKSDNYVPLGCLVALQDGTKLDVWPKSIRLSTGPVRRRNLPNKAPIQREQVSLQRGDVLFFRGDLVHAGSSYAKTNHRVHFFLDNPEIRRPGNNTWFSQAWWISK